MHLLMGKRCGKVAVLIPIVFACAVACWAGDKKDVTKGKRDIDSGSFAVIVKGQRIMTESFSVQQENDNSVVKSRLQDPGNTGTINQKSELQITGSGELVRYEWNDSSGSLVVTPKDEFLLEKIWVAGSAKPAEQPFLMPNTSTILDNNFFIHREVLAWRYLASNCHTDGGNLKCQQAPAEFGVLVPQDRTSLRVRIELAGMGKIEVHGAERELLRLNLKGDALNWVLWVDVKDQFKLIRVDIPEDNTEVVRD